MKTRTTSAAVLGLFGGAALGIWVGAEMASGSTSAQPAPVEVAQAIDTPTPEPVKKTAARRARVVRATPAATATPAEAPKLVMTVPVSAPELHARMKPVLARGTKLPIAVAGFKDAEQFATLAHAARNTQVPFILLKHRVLTEGQSLEAAIRASKPELDAASEVERARNAARSDIAAVSGNAADN